MSDYPGRRRGSSTFRGTTGFRGAPSTQAQNSLNGLMDMVKDSSGNYHMPEAAPYHPVLDPTAQGALQNADNWTRYGPEGKRSGRAPFAAGWRMTGPRFKFPKGHWGLADAALQAALEAANRRQLEEDFAQYWREPTGGELWINCNPPHEPNVPFAANLLCAAPGDTDGYEMDGLYDKLNKWWSPDSMRWFSSWFRWSHMQSGTNRYYPSMFWRWPRQESQFPEPVGMPEMPGWVRYPWGKGDPTMGTTPGDGTGPEAKPPSSVSPDSPSPRPPPYASIPARWQRQKARWWEGWQWPQDSQGSYGPPKPPPPDWEPPDPRDRRPPGRGLREWKGKWNVPKVGRLLREAAERAMEGCEGIDALFKALPLEIQRRPPRGSNGKVSCANQLKVLYRNLGQLDVCKAVENLINNDLEDRVFGMMGEQAQRSAVNHFYTQESAWTKMQNALNEKVKGARGTPPWLPTVSLCEGAPSLSFGGETHSLDEWDAANRPRSMIDPRTGLLVDA